MPKQILPSREAFHAFFEEMKKELGCRVLDRKEMGILLDRIPPQLRALKKKKRGIETCLSYRVEFLEVLWWSTFVETDGAPRKNDEGWVIIVDARFPERPALFSFPIRRTLRYLETTASYLRACVDLVNSWPECPVCKAKLQMRLARTEMHAVAFFCPGGHRKHRFSIYQNISEENKKFLEGVFRRFALYRKRDEEKTGKQRRYSRVIRFEKKRNMLERSKQTGTVVDPTAYDDLKYDHL